MNKKKRKILGVSAGVGVILHPFKDQKILGNIEIRSDFLMRGSPDQFHLNFPGANHSDSITKLWTREGRPDIIIGNPKCGSSSMLALSRGKKFTSHVGEPSLELYLRAIQFHQPGIFFLENLPKLLDSYSRPEFERLFPNYRFVFKEVTASDFGNSQTTRKRLIVIGIHRLLKGSNRMSRVFESFSRKPFKLQNTGDLLSNIPSYCTGHFREDFDELITIYAGKKMTWEQIQQLWLNLKPHRHIPTPDKNFNTAPGVYINWEHDMPLVVRKSNRQFNPAGLPMTPRELCRIQGIPDSFKILSDCENYQKKTLINKGRVVAGNTPPYEMALWFREALEYAGYLYPVKTQVS